MYTIDYLFYSKEIIILNIKVLNKCMLSMLYNYLYICRT